MSGGDNDSEVIQMSEPWGPQQSYKKDIYKQAQTNYRNPSEFYPNQTWLGLNETQRNAMTGRMDYAANELPGMTGQTQGALTQMLNAPDVANNPYISGVADVMETRLNRNLAENVMPTIQGNFNAAGQYGGGREDVMRQNAARDTQEALSQGLAGLYSDAYSQGLGQQAKGMAVSPTIANLGLMPTDIEGQIGDTLLQESYKPLNEDIQRWNYEQQAPWTDLSNYAAAVGGNVGMQSTTQTATPSNPFGSAIGGAMMGDKLFDTMGIGGPSWLGGAVGGLGGLLSKAW